ncbi:MAG: RsmB/NOP family class I SAM-dependent RNA methyltransferase [Dysgonamonadaceae bacterium]|nr:RsmB/NOP family class I SAM-dependent RNA methyltransferase [Dysgonamonadaceae bacterium]
MELPAAFTSRTQALLGDEWPSFEQSLLETPPVSIRFNPAKRPIFPSECDAAVPWASHAYYLKERPVFTLDPLFHAGCYYVQEAASMFLEQVVRAHLAEPAKVLDLCAAPGGKSTQLISVLPEGSLLVANEVIRSRAAVLGENLLKWGDSCTILTNNDPTDFGRQGAFFDAIVADVPCSGEGMFRKDPAAIREWSLSHVQLCAERQRRIVADVWPALKSGGLLIYSTCTYNREENEDNIQWICKELGAEIVEEPHRLMPHRTRGEGFFIAAVRKTSSETRTKKPPKTQAHPRPASFPYSFLHSPQDWTILTHNQEFAAIPSLHESDYHSLSQHFKILSAGVPLGTIKGKDFVPAPALALSSALDLPAFPVWELNYTEAIRYLRKETFAEIPSALPKGIVLVAYQTVPLGFIKNIGTRANNLYPSEWRIRMSLQNDFPTI